MWLLKNRGTRLRAWRIDTAGNVTIITALIMIPLMLCAGAGLDYNRYVNARTDLQGALDSATLASASSKGKLSQEQVAAYFSKNGNFSDVTLDGPHFTIDADGTTIATLHAELPAGLSGITGKTSMSLDLTSQATVESPTQVTEAEFMPINAQGAFDKEIYIFTKDKDGNITSETLALTYDYTLSKGKGTKTYTPAIGQKIDISVGPYETYGIKMVVYQDLTYTGKKTNPVDFYSDAANADSFIKVTGHCEHTEIQNWEDGGDSNFLDFIFKMTCATGSSGKTIVRLTR
jgi:hypothetical protein